MDDRQKSGLLAIAAGVGAYFIVDAADSVRNAIGVLTFFIFYNYGANEIEKDKQKAINDRYRQEIEELKSKLDQLKR